MTLTPDLLALLFAVGVVGGALNAVAGGSSFFTFPVLMWLGLPALQANATNFVALTPSNVAALPAYRNELKEIGWALVGPIALGAVGGVIGTLLLVWFGAGSFERAVPYLLGFATFLFAFAPRLRVVLQQSLTGRWLPAALLFLLSVYGGYFGAGIGQITLAALTLIGLTDFNQANAAKNAVIVAISAIAFVVFSMSGLVSWPHALVMMAGTTLGGYSGGTIARFLPQKALRGGVIGVGVFLTLFYFWAN